MSMLNRISERVHYFFEEKRLLSPCVKVNRFQFVDDGITVLYSFGRIALNHKMPLKHFEMEFYDSLSSYDKQRLIKASILDNVYKAFFKEGVVYDRNDFLIYLKKEFKDDQLF